MEITQNKKGDVTVFEIAGRLDAVTAADAEATLLDLPDEDNIALLINLEKLEYVSSAGLRVLLMVAKKIQSVSGKVALSNLSELVQEVFDISGFSSIFIIVENENDGLTELQS